MSKITKKGLPLAVAIGMGIMAGSLAEALAQSMQYPLNDPSYQVRYVEMDQVTYNMPENRHRTYTSAYPQTATTTYFDVQNIYNPQKIRFLSGGVGEAEQQYIRQSERIYPVKLVFANAQGAYLSDVEVQVSDAKGDKVFQMMADGPILLIDLKPGTYKITADNGFMKRSDTITVAENRHVNKTLMFNNDARSAHHR